MKVIEKELIKILLFDSRDYAEELEIIECSFFNNGEMYNIEDEDIKYKCYCYARFIDSNWPPAKLLSNDWQELLKTA